MEPGVDGPAGAQRQLLVRAHQQGSAQNRSRQARPRAISSLLECAPCIRRALKVLVKHLPLVASILALGTAACAPKNFELTTAKTPFCTAEANSQWERAVIQTQGVNGYDPKGHYIAEFRAEKFGALNINNWRPLSGYKETQCGQLHHFNIYDGLWSAKSPSRRNFG